MTQFHRRRWSGRGLHPGCILGVLVFLGLGVSARATASPALQPFLTRHCVECHDAETRKGGLDLTAAVAAPETTAGIDRWVGIHDRVASGEMPPPKKKSRPTAGESRGFTNALAKVLLNTERQRIAREGRATQRRMNRHEYEQTVRDLLFLPALEVKGFLPEDGVVGGFNKVGAGLDVSHVHLGRYLSAAEFAVRSAMAPRVEAPKRTVQRFHAWDQGEFFGLIPLDGPKERRTFPLVGLKLMTNVMATLKRDAEPDADRRQREAMGVVVSTYEPTEIRFGGFRAPMTGRYRLRASGYSFWMGPKFTQVSKGRRSEPVTLYADSDPRILRRLGSFDFGVEPTVCELEVDLLAGETIRPDAARLHRSRPPDHRNPLTEADGMPGVAFQWLEVEGPIFEQWPPAGHQALFGALPIKDRPKAEGVSRRRQRPAGVAVESAEPAIDAERLLRSFLGRAYRGTVAEADVARFVTLVKGSMATGSDFTEAMIAGYTAVLSSPSFLYIDEPKPGKLADGALAERLSFFLWNAAPDAELRALAAKGRLQKPDVLRAQTERLLDDPRSRQFIDAFLDYWLDLRGIAATAPDEQLYPDYQLDDLLVESMATETQVFFGELIRRNLGITNLVDSEFAMLNERLARHYGIEGVDGVGFRRVPLRRERVRGGLLTQASVLKVTANGTTTSPVKRGAWVMSRIIGRPPPPAPPSVPAVEPDIRGATTIREQLAKHRTQESCNACHRLIDPAGFALENFDVMGGWRTRYRASGGDPVKGIGHNGNFFHFGLGPDVDASGELPDGRTFQDVRELKQLLVSDREQLARNLVRQLVVYATGAPVGFADRPEIEEILRANRRGDFPVRSLIHGVVQSDLFRNK
jgi:hypothetical protein